MARQYKNDEERRQWVLNDEGLYDWWKSTGVGLYRFVQTNRAQLDDIIGRALGIEPRR